MILRPLLWTPYPSLAKIAAMRRAFSSSRPIGAISISEILFLLVLVLFLVVVCVWPILTWRLHHFSTWTADAAHSYAVRDHAGGTVYVTPAFGKFYVSLPWLWASLLAATVVTGLFSPKNPGDKK
jgi:hypothetical protein